jgi:hypothetical protein
MEESATSRHESLAELELSLGLQTPPQFQAERLALQMKKLRERFGKGDASNASDADRLLAWCAQPGVCDEVDRQRSDLIFSKIARTATVR